MKKYILATFFLAVFTLTLEPARNLMSKFLMLEQPQYHQIQQGEWLSKIAIKYYGDASYWRELELINRAPNGDRIYPGESIIIPSYEAMREIRRTQKLSSVNELIQTQERLIASGYREERAPMSKSDAKPQAEPSIPTVSAVEEEVIEETEEVATAMPAEESGTAEPEMQNGEPLVVYGETPEPDYFGEDSDFGAQTSKSNLFLYGVGAILILALGIFFYVRKKKSEEVAYYGDVQQLEEVKEDEKDDADAEKGNEPYQFRQSLYMNEKNETDGKKTRKEEKVNEKEFVS